MSTVISVEHLSKSYRLGQINTGTFTYDMQLWWAKVRGKPNPFLTIGEADESHRDGEIIWALKDVSFTVEQGEVLGIIGRNGAGKSTLLKILSRVTSPTSGKVKIKGRIASLLEVGTGFHPDLTGRENVYLNGAIMGMDRQEVARKFDEIVDFSGVDQFIDTPVKRYSSGMYVRLAFAVAAHLDPEILVVDEVLAVGDAAFQKKCIGKMGEVAKGGRTVLFVSHQMDIIRSLCARSVLLNKGELHVSGDTQYVVDTYLGLEKLKEHTTHFELVKDESLEIQIIKGRILGDDDLEKDDFDVFSEIVLEFEYLVAKPVMGAVINFELRKNGSTIFLSFDTDENNTLLERRIPGYYVSRIKIPSPMLKPGLYTISTNTGVINMSTFQHLDDILSFSVELKSRSSSFLSYSEKRNGIIAMPLKWNIQKTGTYLEMNHGKI